MQGTEHAQKCFLGQIVYDVLIACCSPDHSSNHARIGFDEAGARILIPRQAPLDQVPFITFQDDPLAAFCP
jgi:hypothetical protein